MIPPRMHRGMVTRAQMTRMTTMVPNGKACVDCRSTSSDHSDDVQLAKQALPNHTYVLLQTHSSPQAKSVSKRSGTSTTVYSALPSNAHKGKQTIAYSNACLF